MTAEELNARRKRLYDHARWEGRLTVFLWLAALVWTVGYCWLRGYDHDADALLVRWGWAVPNAEVFPLRLGMPNWIFWGVFAPWVMATLLTATLSFFLPDDPLRE
ncbi:MAG: hypothetical protein RMJ19_04790 [Gemmatales bacterium]|nr:hypothetical protein [Gemmatales bacterium]MCS7159769.1 hypothetical protein [Gemmatales bacterium]MDW8174967.1 hypothetical protein [Gemmatales bacterium]MDW8222579.1 hypothetical protein [Gemmatales bacterium]